MIPTFLNFDVEPAGFQSDHASWRGFREWVEVVDGVRAELADRSGRAPIFGWYFRMDPQIASVHGDAAYGARHFADLVQHLSEQGDVFGVHVHPLRWSTEREVWIHDFADRDWVRHCIETAHEAYTESFRDPPLRFRGGAGFVDDQVVDVIDRLGFGVDLTVEPGFAWPGDQMHTQVDASPCVGDLVDCSTAPRAVYRPSSTDFRVPDASSGRRVVMVPLSASARLPEKPAWWRLARAVRHPRRPRARVVLPSRPWPSPEFFWDLLAAEAGSMRRPYVSLAFRTDPLAGAAASRIAALLRALPAQPVAPKLDCSDPFVQAPALL